jgi:hypothetical protein
VGSFSWEQHPDGPFATLIGVAATYCSPDAYDGAYDDLISRAREPDPDDEEIGAFRAGPWQALADPGQLPGRQQRTPHWQFQASADRVVPAPGGAARAPDRRCWGAV